MERQAISEIKLLECFMPVWDGLKTLSGHYRRVKLITDNSSGSYKLVPTNSPTTWLRFPAGLCGLCN